MKKPTVRGKKNPRRPHKKNEQKNLSEQKPATKKRKKRKKTHKSEEQSAKTNAKSLIVQQNVAVLVFFFINFIAVAKDRLTCTVEKMKYGRAYEPRK